MSGDYFVRPTWVEPTVRSADSMPKDVDPEGRPTSRMLPLRRPEGSVHDLGVELRDRSGKRWTMALPQGLGLCPHGLNKSFCLTCFHAKPAAPKPKATPGQPALRSDPVVSAVKARATPPPAGPTYMGERADGTANVAPEPPPGEVVRGRMPVPVQHHAHGAPSASGKVLTSFDYAQDQGRVGKDGFWHPPKHTSIVDRLPRHPNAKDPPKLG